MFTEEQKKEIQHTRELIATLARMQDKIYQQLVKDLGFLKYFEEKESLEYTGKEHLNPEQYLFDLVYNTTDLNFEDGVKLIERKVNEYNLA